MMENGKFLWITAAKNFIASRGQQDDINAEHFPLGLIEKLEEVQRDETQYAAAGVPADTQAALFAGAGPAKLVFDAVKQNMIYRPTY